jgi:hypothetical protein
MGAVQPQRVQMIAELWIVSAHGADDRPHKWKGKRGGSNWIDIFGLGKALPPARDERQQGR